MTRSGAVKLRPNAIVSPVGINSKNTPLGSGETFTGTYEWNDHNDVMVTCLTDNTGTIYFDFSHDGTTTHSTFPSAGFELQNNIGFFHVAFKGPRYFRLRLVNDTGAQSSLSLQTSYGPFRQGSSPLNQTIASDADALITRSVSTDLDLAFGRFSGMAEDTKFGFVRGTDAADNVVTVWAFANDALSTRSDRKPFPTSASTLYLASDAAGDTSLDFEVEVINGLGVRSYVPVTSDASDGTTPVSFAASAGMDVNRAELVGDTQTHAGNIYITNANDFSSGVPNDPTNDVLAFIPAGYGQTHQNAYFVPAGFKCRIKYIVITVARASGAAGSADLELLVKKPSQSWVVKREYAVQTGSFPFNCSGLVFDPLTRWEWIVKDVSDTDTNVSINTIFELASV